MNVANLIGSVVGQYLQRAIEDPNAGSDGTARYVIDCLNPEQTAAIARSVLAQPTLAPHVEMKLPAGFLQGFELPPNILTDKPATYFRNAPCERPVLLLANTGDDEEQSLKELTRIGGAELQEQPGLWVRAATDGIALTPEHSRWWEKALAGLFELRMFSLSRLAAYVLRVRDGIATDGLPLIQALGAALPALRLPKESMYFNGVKEAQRGQVSAWKRLFNNAFKRHACYLVKQTPTQLILSEDDLRDSFGKVRDQVPATHHPAIEVFIAAPSGWNQAAARLAECEWGDIKPLFDGLRREKYNLGAETLNFFDDRDPSVLDDADRDYLKLLVERKPTEPTEEDAEFYEAHRGEIKIDRKLRSAWEVFVFGRARETEDFIAGLAACLESLFSQAGSTTNRHLRIRCDRATKKDLRELNVDAGLYFARRYGGIQALLSHRVTWNVGQLFAFEQLVEGWKTAGKAKAQLTRSTAKANLQLKFTLELEVENVGGGSSIYTSQLVWRFDPNTVASEFCSDWSRLKDHPLVTCRANRVLFSAKGRFQTVDLSNVKTFQPVHDRDRGSFVPTYKTANNVELTWLDNLREAHRQGLVTALIASELEARFKEFAAAYGDAIRGMLSKGLAATDLLEKQLRSFGTLLDTLCRKAKGDRNRELLLRPLLSIGAIEIEGGPTAVVVAPWHPMRMFAMSRKARLVANLAQHLLTTENVLFGEPRLFFKDLANDLGHVFYPEVVLGWQLDKAELLVATDFVQDYSLHEPPIASEEDVDDTNENPTDGSNRVLELIQRYLALHPHEHANMSVVLFNCDSARLPQAVVDKIGTLYEGEEDVRCQVLLRHVDMKRLRDLYRDIVALPDRDGDAFNASEATQDFMARLRICIVADQAPVPDPKDGCPYDIVFSQDVIARHARLKWYRETARPIDADRLVPSQWSRRRPAAKDDMRSVVYMCCPVQSQEGWSYLTAVTSFLEGDWDEKENERLLPARELDFRDPRTARIFGETHNLGNWVVNYDELLDRRQLLNQSVQIIRYKQSATQGRNVIISSKAPIGLLRSMILRRIKDLALGLSDADYVKLAHKFIDDANDISGDIVLRAAKRGRNASELMGVVLSRYLIRHEIGVDRHAGTYFLDDYAEWLGHREEQIADILILSPEQLPDGTLRLAMIATEAKYGDAANISAKRKESQKQLRDTVVRMEEAIFGNPERLDRNLWLARLSDLILDGIQIPASTKINLADWRRSIREGECEIFLRGYSHVFAAEPANGPDVSDFSGVVGLDDSYQEVFGRPRLKELVLRYAKDSNPMSVRTQVADRNVWEKQRYRKPSDLKPKFITTPKPPPDKPDEPAGGSSAPVASEITKQGPQATGASPSAGGTPPDSSPSSGSSFSGYVTQAPLLPTPSSPTSRASFLAASSGGWAYDIGPLLPSQAEVQDSETDKEWLKSTEFKLRNALQQFHLQAKLVSAKLTPNAALIKFAGSASLTVEQVAKRRSELLTTHGLSIIGLQPEPGVVSLSVERPTRKIIQLKDVWARWKPETAQGNQDLLIALREDDGELLFLSPGKLHAPHTLIAGSTGSGKSVLMQNIILGIAATNRPAQARIVLIDPKQGVDYFQFDGLPHLQTEIIDDQAAAISQMDHLVAEMDARYAKFKTARVPNLSAYNQKVPVDERLPTLWLIHDEFAEWMMVEDYKVYVASIVGRLGVKARAAGIHLVFAAQRPDASVMPMQLRANLGNRLILRVDSEGTSEIALGEKGAERLLGRGHMLAKLEGVAGLTYAQVPLAEPSFMEAVVSQIARR